VTNPAEPSELAPVHLPRSVDVVVIGDGPGGSALAAACAHRGVDVVLVGPDEPWAATYATWVDDLAGIDLDGMGLIDPAAVLRSIHPTIAAHTDRAHELSRPYGVIDNDALRTVLRTGVEHVIDRAIDVRDGTPHRVELLGGGTITARLVFDTTGWPATFARRMTGRAAPAWQTALGVVLDRPPDGDLGRAVLMDFRPVRAARDAGSTANSSSASNSTSTSTIGPSGVSTFCYSLPVEDGWLIEETVLAARPAVEPIALVARLAARLGRHPDDLLAAAVRTEYVRIPMGGPRPHRDQPVVAFGAAAGYVNPATGFSVASSLRAAPRVADAVVRSLDATPTGRAVDAAPVADAVWPLSMRRSRVLHDYGLEMLLGLDAAGVRAFFGDFFDLPVERWSTYLRVDSSPTEIGAVMTQLFRSASWPMRRRLMSANPAMFARLLRP
jgi:lycopene beta-cyclase